MIRISAKREGFRRCGIAHSVAPIEHPDTAFTDDQIQRLMAEPLLTVEVERTTPDVERTTLGVKRTTPDVKRTTPDVKRRKR